MLYFPLAKTKILLYVLFFLLFLNVLFVSTKNYSISISDVDLKNITEMDYREIISSHPILKYKANIIQSTEITYLYIFPESSILFIYLGYFLVGIFFIKILKTIPRETVD
jgi:hypothetical protein